MHLGQRLNIMQGTECWCRHRNGVRIWRRWCPLRRLHVGAGWLCAPHQPGICRGYQLPCNTKNVRVRGVLVPSRELKSLAHVFFFCGFFLFFKNNEYEQTFFFSQGLFQKIKNKSVHCIDVCMSPVHISPIPDNCNSVEIQLSVFIWTKPRIVKWCN